MTHSERTKLIQLLNHAEYLASQFSDGYPGEFLSAQAFYEALQKSIHQLKQGDKSQLKKLYLWFLPSSCWDDFVGSDGQDLADEITDILSKAIAI